MKILVTGAAGFIGAAVSTALLERGHTVVGIDNLNNYYDPALKSARLVQFDDVKDFRFIKLDIGNRDAVAELFAHEKPLRVVHMAAQAGVRYSIENPFAYADSNLLGFLAILEGCRRHDVEHLIYASSSSVYGANEKMPFSVHDNVDHPLSLYAATKKSNELMAHSYAHLYGLPSTGLRFFTVYGPWGRPDMAPFLFTKKIFAGEAIEVFNNGNHARDFTYIDDIVEGVVRTCDQVARPDLAWSGMSPNPSSSKAPYRVYNIGNNKPVGLMDFIAAIETATGKMANIKMAPMQPGDVETTFADVEALKSDVGFRPDTPLAEGIMKLVAWYREFYRVC